MLDQEPVVTEHEQRANAFLNQLEEMDSFEIAEGVHRLGLTENSIDVFPELAKLLRENKKGFTILLSILRAKNGPIDSDTKIKAQSVYEQVGGEGIPELELARKLDKLQIPNLPNTIKYKNAQRLIDDFRKAIEGFKSRMKQGPLFWDEVLFAMEIESAILEEVMCAAEQRMDREFPEIPDEYLEPPSIERVSEVCQTCKNRLQSATQHSPPSQARSTGSSRPHTLEAVTG
tara:strand:+ start:794 stop:1486 length:693 start_codon:yes stop_codon:yes gene_type:complete